MTRNATRLFAERGGSAGLARAAAALCSCLAAGGLTIAADVAPEPARSSIAFLPALDFHLGRPALSSSQSTIAPTSTDRLFPLAFAASPAVLRGVASQGLSDDLVARMASEAQRYRSGHVYDLATGPDPFDSIGEELRAEEAERIVTRAFNRTLDARLDVLARSSDRMAAALARLEDLGSGFRTRRGRAERDATDLIGPQFDTGKSGAHASLGLRLGAHPALSLRGGFLGVRGRMDLPLLGEPLRLSLERSIGPRGRASLTAGADRDGHDWAALAFGFSF